MSVRLRPYLAPSPSGPAAGDTGAGVICTPRVSPRSVAALRLPDDSVELDVGGRRVHLSSLGRVLWPEYGYTKAHMLDYYARVAPVLLPHLAGRPLTLHRFPEGVGGPHFFQTRVPPHPPWIRAQRMWTFSKGKDVDAPIIDDLAGLVWA